MNLTVRRVEVGALMVSRSAEDVLVTYALGSCVGVILHHPSGVGALAHIQLPSSLGAGPRADGDGAFSYADRAVPELLRRAYLLGAERRRLRVVLAGGATVVDPRDYFQIGRKNYLAVRRILWQEGIFIDKEAVGGPDWRTLRLEVGSGRISIQSSKGIEEL